MKYIFCCLFLLCFANAFSQSVDTFEVRYPLRETVLNKKSIAYLDKLISKNKLAPGQKIMLLGYADYRGTAAHNDTVSTERATGIQDYLISKGFSKSDITQCMGKGKIERPGMTGKSGYAPDRKVLIITSNAATKMDIKELQVNETVTLRNIFFEGGLPDIAQSSMPELENLYNFMQQNAKVTIQIEGHVCCKGIPTVNEGPYNDDKVLSQLRAQSIYKYLTAKGINKDRMKYIGFGTSKPKVYPARTENEQQQNRRVEIRILSK